MRGLELHPNHEFSYWTIPKLQWNALALERDLPAVVSAGWHCEAGLDQVPPNVELLYQARYSDMEVATAEVGDSLAHIVLNRGLVDVQIAGPSVEEAEAAMEVLRRAFPEKAADEETRILPISFWHHSNDRANASHRTVAVPPWSEVESNYPETTRTHLDPLMRSFEPGEGGRLILWHGAPGTGKTFALRAMGWEWREWCRIHYIVDPETFFGKEPGYLLDVALSAQKRAFGPQRDEDPKWHLVVLEDTGEMLAPDAKVQVGQALSRLLNLADGILGQGLRLLFLVTTNEPLANVHPALARPGRCAASVEFDLFSEDEGRRWLLDRGGPAEEHTGQATLAHLHGLLEGRGSARLAEPVGFLPVGRGR